MVLVVDSGSTKTHWVTGGLDGSHRDIVTVGLPPRMTTDDQFREATRQVASQLFTVGTPQHIFFYGTGCSGAQHRERYRCLLQEQWPTAAVTVESDLLGACRALLSDGSGLVGILGTGSNACRYVDGAIVHQLPSLGYLLGDEGSGCHLGAILWKRYWKQQLPTHLQHAFHAQFPYTLQEFLDTVYQNPHPNRFLAAATRFVFEYRDEPAMQELVRESFAAYLRQQIVPLSDGSDSRLSFVGGVAWSFADLLRQTVTVVCPTLRVDSVLADPVQQLLDYHLKTIEQQ